MNFGQRGVTGTVSLPGTGLSYQHRFGSLLPPTNAQPPVATPLASQPKAPISGKAIATVAVCVGVAALFVGGLLSSRAPTRESSAGGSVSVQPDVVATPSSPVETDGIRVPTTNAASTAKGTKIDPDAPGREVPPSVVRGNNLTATVRTSVQSANVRSEPSMSASIVQVLPKGSTVHVLQAENGWLRVSGPDGLAIGWVYASLLQ